jgi:SAM-dependent methyltransferase
MNSKLLLVDVCLDSLIRMPTMIRNILKRVTMTMSILGIDLIKMVSFVRGFAGFISDYLQLRKQIKGNGFKVKFYPILEDKYKQGGMAKGHYFHQDLLVARKIYQAKPKKHLDIGSRVDGFIAHLATFRKVIIIDIRELKSKIDNIEFIQADMMNVKEDLFESCDSMSCLHALEHFGLGRYGDPLDIDGHLKGFENMYHILKPKGVFYFSVPIGPQRIEFNAHRVFSIEYLLEIFQGKFEIFTFSFVDDRGDLNLDVELTDDMIVNNCNCYFGCGIFELYKISKND